ncbi:aldo/keto reductase [Agarilytica rhodophyticola]|uniref:aldo/keto reductase n=1 Tax=Agarilytica rhodophyticola TaxID=1737490 RepID=UPI000B348C24|nr:aldo/keto reductase [Agarilytica rhodophyticola]
MHYTNLGNSGLYVSRLCFGVMTFGGDVKSEMDAKNMVDMAIDAGINFFDTANIYTDGVSEEMLGKALKGKRDTNIIATKVYFTNNVQPHEAFGASRKGIMLEVEKSLKRLDTDYIDLYQLHAFDRFTPIDETLSTMHDLVHSGKVRYIGLSNYAGWQIARAHGICECFRFEKFISSQNYYSLVGRDLEYEILPACKDLGLGILVWSPLAGGFLAASEKANRRKAFPMPPVDSRYAYDILDVVKVIAKKYDATAAQISTAWLLHQSGISAVLTGASDIPQLSENLESVDIQLDATDLEALDKVSQPAYIYPQWSKMVNTERGVFDADVTARGTQAVIDNKRNSVLI